MGEYEDKYDNYPLMRPFSNYAVEGEGSVTVDFSANVTSGPAPLAVRFEDLSDRVTFWKWAFDGDEAVDSTGKDPVYAYEKPGVYTVSLAA